MVRRSVAAAAAVALALVLGACGSGSGNRYGASTTSTATQPAVASPTTAAPRGVDPNAPEVSPAGDIPDNQVFVPYTPPGGQFTVKVPEGWARTAHAGTVTQVRRAGGGVVLVTYKAEPPADPVTGKVVHDALERYELWRGGTEAILTLAGPVGADNVDPWRIVSDSFRWR